MCVLISVIVPIYNVEEWLNDCLKTVCIQANDLIEVILVDDGSTDSSFEICDQYQHQYENVCVIHKDNGGLVSARKAGIRIARGKYISFVDGDDWIDPGWYKKVAEIVKEKNCDVLAYGCIEEYGNCGKKVINNVKNQLYEGEKLKILKKKLITKEDAFFSWSILPHVADKVIKKNIIEQVIATVSNDISFGEDATISYGSIWNADSLVVLDETPYHYRQRIGSITKTNKANDIKAIKKIHDCLLRNHRYNIDSQVNIYMIFLLLLRAYPQLCKGMNLYPFSEISKNDKVVIYGAGGFGKSLQKYISKTHCVQIISWIDKNALEYQNIGMNIDEIKKLDYLDFDYLIIAILNENICREIEKELNDRGISSEKIKFITMHNVRQTDLTEILQ